MATPLEKSPFQTSSDFNVASSPHWRDGSSLAQIQLLWLAALLPAVWAAWSHFGLMGARVLCLATATAVMWDALGNRIFPGKDHTTNLSSVTLGLLLGLVLPVDAPWWLVTVGTLLMILVGKKLFGGWGGYPVHPVALSYAMLAVSWPGRLDRTAALAGLDWPVTMVEPLRLVKTLGPAAEDAFAPLDLLRGDQVAGVGDGMVAYLAAGGLLLVLLRQVPWQIPLGTLLGTAGAAAALAWLAPDKVASAQFHLLTGGTALMAFFLLADHTTSPVNAKPMLCYGLLAGLLMVLIRTFSSHFDGGMFALLLVNLCSPLLDRWAPRVKGLGVGSDA